MDEMDKKPGSVLFKRMQVENLGKEQTVGGDVLAEKMRDVLGGEKELRCEVAECWAEEKGDEKKSEVAGRELRTRQVLTPPYWGDGGKRGTKEI